MRLATTTGDFLKYTNDQIKSIGCLQQAGFRYVDLSLYSPDHNKDLLISDSWCESAQRIKAYMLEQGLDFVQSHGPNVNPLGGEQKVAEALALTNRALEVCAYLGIPYTVVHGGVNWNIKDKDEWVEKNASFFRSLIPMMEKTGVMVLFENSASSNTGDTYYPNTGADCRAFVELLQHPLFGVCWDTGHANIEGSQYDEITALGHHLKAVHFNDNLGTVDQHVIPMMGTLNVDEILNALIDVGYQGALTYECGAALRPYRYWLGDRRPFERENRLANPTLDMQCSLERFMYELGVQLLKAYDLFED